MEDDITQDTTDVSTLNDSDLDELLTSSEEGTQSSDEDGSAEGVSKDGDEDVSKNQGNVNDTHEGGETIKEPTDLEKLQKQLDEKELLMQRQANELGDLRKKERERLETQPSQLDPLKETYGEETVDEISIATKAQIDRDNALSELEKDHLTQQRESNERIVLGQIPGVLDMLDDIAELAKNDGFNDANIVAFKADPFATSDPAIILSYARQVKSTRETNALKSELEKLREKQEGTIKRIEEASSSPSGLTSKVASSGNNSAVSISADQIPNLSDEDLDKLLQKI